MSTRRDTAHRAPAYPGAGRQGARRRYARAGRRPPQHRARRRQADERPLAGQASRALGWSFGSTLLNKASLFGIGVLLARLLGPHAFGTYAVAYVALVALLNFNELGVSLAIVRWPGDPREIIPTVTTISLLVSAIIYTACFFAAPAYASAMGAPAATTVIRVLATAVLTDGFTNTPAALLQRNFRQGQRTIADQVNVWLSTGVTVALAWSGFGAMSLAIGRVAGGAAGAILLLRFAPESLRLGFDPVKARALLRFGLPLAGANLVAFAVMSVDQVIVGHVLGPVALGFYVLALNLASWPITMFSQPVRNVGPAVLARLQHDGTAMRNTVLSAAGLLCAVALPICLLISGSARPLISVVYGARWLPAAQPLLCLALLAGVQVFLLVGYDLFVVLARSRFLLTTQLIWLLALVAALAAGARLAGLFGASVAELGVAAGCVLPLYLAEFSKVGIRLRDLGKHVWLPLAGAALAGLFAFGASQLAPNDFTALAASGVATLAIVGLLLHRMRAVLAVLRSSASQPVAAGATSAAGATVAAGATSAPRTARLPADTAPARDALPTKQHTELTATVAAGGSLAADFPASPLSRQKLSEPLYWRTVAALRWDPAFPAHRDRPRAPILAQAHRYGRQLLGETAEILHDPVREEQT